MLEILKNEIGFLKGQLSEKDNQIQHLLRLNENNQILLKQFQNSVLLLQSKNTDNFVNYILVYKY
jgi:hypothetical protein